jgi:hypothetical protein
MLVYQRVSNQKYDKKHVIFRYSDRFSGEFRHGHLLEPPLEASIHW